LAARRNLPFLLFESPEFIEFQKELNPRAEGISGQTVRDNIVQSYNVGLELLREELKVSGSSSALHAQFPPSSLFRKTPQSSLSRLTTGRPATRHPSWASTSTTSTTIGNLVPTFSTSLKSMAHKVGENLAVHLVAAIAKYNILDQVSEPAD